MRNTWIICRKEMRSYFSSPVAYLLLTMFAVLFGWFFWNVLGYVVANTTAAMMRGQSFPMNINEEIIRPLLSNVGVMGLFFIPLITMRLFAEEKRTGTIELLTTSPTAGDSSSPAVGGVPQRSVRRRRVRWPRYCASRATR